MSVLEGVRDPPDRMPRFRVSVISCAYNEAANIGRFLEAILGSEGPSFDLEEVIVVASGCTDATESIVAQIAARDRRVRLIHESLRSGKASALAKGLAAARGEIEVVEGADTVPIAGALEALITPFRDHDVSLVCGRPMPAESGDSFISDVSRTMWDVHHLVSRQAPKSGEAYAIRRRNFVLPADIEDDDTYVGAIAVQDGGRSVYAERAIFLNRTPTTARELVRQRWRVNRQQLGLRRSTGVESSTWNPSLMVEAIAGYLRTHPDKWNRVVGLLVFEGLARGLATMSVLTDRRPYTTWEPIDSTKHAIRGSDEGVATSDRPPPGS